MQKNKTIDIYWTIHPNWLAPSAMYKDPFQEQVLAPCPVVADYNKRIRYLPTPYHLKIKPIWKYNQVINDYEFVEFEAESRDLQTDYLWSTETTNETGQKSWYDPYKAQFQIITPYIFLCEEPMNMYLEGLQSSATKSKIDEVRFVEAVIDIQNYPRALSSAYAFQTRDSEAEFIKGEPHTKLVFTDKVRLHKFTATPKLEQWLKTNTNLVMYQRGTRNLFDIVKDRKPKGLFKEIKKNIEYSEP